MHDKILDITIYAMSFGKRSAQVVFIMLKCHPVDFFETLNLLFTNYSNIQYKQF